MRLKITGILLIVLVVTSVWYDQAVAYAQGGAKCTNNDDPERVSLSPNGKYVMARWRKFVRVWEAATGKYINQFNTIADYGIDSAVFSPNSQYILIGEDIQATLWDIESGKQIRIFPKTNIANNSGYSAIFSDDGEWILASIDNGIQLDIWKTKTSEKLWEFEQAPLDSGFDEAQLSKSKNYLLVEALNGSFQLWDVPHHKLIRTFEVASVRLSPDEQFVLLDERISLSLRRLDDNREVWRISHGGSHIDVSDLGVFSPDGKYIIGGEDHWVDGHVEFMTIHLWDAQSGKELYEFGNKDLPMSTARFLPNSKYLVAEGYSHWGLYLWDISAKKIVRQIDKNTQYLDFDITDDGKTVVLIKDNRIILWDFVAGKEIRQFC